MLVRTRTTAYWFKKEWDSFLSDPCPLSDGQCEELMAYYNGEPVTMSIVEEARKKSVEEKAPLPREVKSLGCPRIKCKDVTIENMIDLSTLLRNFDYVSDLYELDKNLEEIKLPFSSHEVLAAINRVGFSSTLCAGGVNNWGVRLPNIRSCLDCIEYLRPKNSSYYLRYTWELKDDLSLKLENDRVIPKENVFKFMKLVGSTLPESVRMYMGEFSSLVMDYDLYPIVYIAANANEGNLLRLLLSHRPSALLYFACTATGLVGYNPIIILIEGDFENEPACTPPEDWISRVNKLSGKLANMPISLTYMKEEDRHKLLATLGFRDKSLGNVDAQAAKPFHLQIPVNRRSISSILLEQKHEWMTSGARAYIAKIKGHSLPYGEIDG